MLKNINPEELNNRSSNSENIDDSQNINDDEQEPLCSFDISLNNGKKASLIIYDEDNYEQKVEDFCQKYKISPQDGQVLLKRVKEELELSSNNNISNNNITNNNISKSDNKTKEEINTNINKTNINNNNMINNMPKKENLFLGNKNYVAKEGNKLDHILNESESMSLSESLKKSNDKVNNLIKDYNNPINNNVQNKVNMKQQIPDNNNNNIKNELNNKNINPINNNSIFSQIPTKNTSMTNNIPGQNRPKYYIVNDNKNKNKNKKKQISRYPLKNTTNSTLYKFNNNSNIPNLNTTYQNNNIISLNSPKENNNIKDNYDVYSFNPNKAKTTFRNGLVGQKIEFIDNNNFANNNNKNNVKIMTPKTEVKFNNLFYPYSTSSNAIKKEYNNSVTYGYPVTSNFNIEPSPVVNKNETVIYDYENPHIINNNNFISHSPIVNKKNTTKVTKILDTYPITITDNNYCNQNNINSPKCLNINYDNLNNNTYETIIKPEVEYTDYSKNNITTINSPNYNSTTNFDTTNNHIIEYNNNYDSITASPILNYDKYDSINNQIVEYHYDTQPLENININNIENNNNIYNTQSDFPIYEKIIVEKKDLNNNNINIGNDINIVDNNQVIEYEIQKNIVPEYTTYVEPKNINNINNINNNNINQIDEVIDINENIINNYTENNQNQEKKRNTVFISNVKKITDNEIVQNDYINENNNLNNNVNELDIYSDVNQIKSEENNIEDNHIQENENNYIIINNNNANNSITKENNINIPRSSPNKTKENHNRNLSVVQTQNLDYKAQEQKKKNIISYIKPNINEQIENKSNDIYIKKNIDLFNSPKNKIISNNTIREAINLNLKNEANNINKKPENNIKQKYIIKENIPQIKQKYENESDINKINKDTYKNSNSSANASPKNNKSINKTNLINNNNKNDSLTSSNIYEDNNMSEKKKNIERLEESLNQQNMNENSTESKIIIEEENSERGPQDNYKKTTTKVDLPKDTDESNYKESEIQYDNLSLDSKNNINNINNNIDQKNNLKNNNLYESNNENNNENKINFINEDDEIKNSINNGSSNYQNSNKKKDKNNKHRYNNSNNLKTDSNYYISNNYNINNNKKDKIVNYLDKDLEINRPKYKKNIVQQNSSKNKKGKINNVYQKKEINNNKKIIPQKKPIMKVLTIRKTNIDKNNNNINNFIIDKRSNSSGAKSKRNNRIKNNNTNNLNGKAKYPGERLYENYMKRLPKQMEKKQKILDERLKEENKELLLKPKIDENSRRIIKRMRDNDDGKNRVEERLINYGNNKRQKHLIEYANKDLQNQIQNPFTPKINKISREIAEKNKQNRINETMNLIEGKKHKYNFKTMDLDKEFSKRNRSIGNEHKNANSFINFDESKNNNNIKTKNTIKRHSNINSESNLSNNLNSYRNSKPDNNTIEENNQNSSRLNKTFDLNNAYRELYNSIDEKMDSDLTRFFGTNGELYSDNNNNNISKKNTVQKEKKTKSIFPDRSLTPNKYIKNYQNYNAFDYLYYESENKGKKNKKKQELSFKKNHPFKPRISTFAQNMKNKKESMNEFVNRISKNLEEIRTSNSKSKNNKQINSDKNSKNNDNNNFRPRISRGPKNINQRNVTVNLDGFYDQRITKEKKELQQSKKEDELEKKNLYNQKSKDIIIKMKIKKYKELFALLDSDQDGVISEDKIQLTKVEENILKNIKPILEELKQTKEEMNFKEFCLKLDKLMTEEKENNHENNK